MSERKIFPCPFCGGEAEIHTDHDFTSNCYNTCIRCKNCGAKTRGIDTGISVENSIGHMTEQNQINLIIDLWNKRKPMEKVVEKLEKLKSKLCRKPTTVAVTIDGLSTIMDCVINIVKAGGSDD